MVAFCPHELFTKYQASADKGHLGWEQQFATFLTKLVNDMDRAIKKGKDRINSTGPVGPDDPAAVMAAAGEAEQEERIVFLEEQSKQLTQQMEEFGELGEVEKAQELLAQVESLKQNISSIKATIGRRLTICEVCSACLVANETAQRMDAHLIGKQHTGYLKIRQWLEAWKKSPFYVAPRNEFGRDRDAGRRDFDRGDRGGRGRYGDDRDHDDRDRRGGRGGWRGGNDRGFDDRGGYHRGGSNQEWRNDRDRRGPPPPSRFDNEGSHQGSNGQSRGGRSSKWDERPENGTHGDSDSGKATGQACGGLSGSRDEYQERSGGWEGRGKDTYDDDRGRGNSGRNRDPREESPSDSRRRRY
ncbi:Luc7-like protein 3 [Phlyctochytrium planicorne]|nr:Luc7-like protein 3 [Phlyctochytrium planicorne]